MFIFRFLVFFTYNFVDDSLCEKAVSMNFLTFSRSLFPIPASERSYENLVACHSTL